VYAFIRVRLQPGLGNAGQSDEVAGNWYRLLVTTPFACGDLAYEREEDEN